MMILKPGDVRTASTGAVYLLLEGHKPDSRTKSWWTLLVLCEPPERRPFDDVTGEVIERTVEWISDHTRHFTRNS